MDKDKEATNSLAKMKILNQLYNPIHVLTGISEAYVLLLVIQVLSPGGSWPARVRKKTKHTDQLDWFSAREN